MTKLRIISDLHYTCGINGPDYNKTYKQSGLWHYFGKKFQENVDFTLIAGDICEGIEKHKEFLKEFFSNQKVIFIDGNHSIYFVKEDNSKPILSEVKQKLKEMFPLTHLFWKYLENDWCWIDENTAIIGSTFYTDYKYCDLTLEELNKKAQCWHTMAEFYGLKVDKFEPYKKLDTETIKFETMSEARSRLNDFQWGKENTFTKLSPEYYLKLHKLAKKEVKRCHNEILSINPNANIILITHHGLSPKMISEKYKKGLLNASYVSDLENWVDKQLPGVKLVISGHVHNRCDFTFGKRNIRYIVNPCGYIPYNEPFDKPKFNPNLIIDTNTL